MTVQCRLSAFLLRGSRAFWVACGSPLPCHAHPPTAIPPLPHQVIDITWPVAEGPSGLSEALTRVAEEAGQAIDDGYDYIVLSDRNAGEGSCRGGAGVGAGQGWQQEHDVWQQRGAVPCSLLSLRTLQRHWLTWPPPIPRPLPRP